MGDLSVRAGVVTGVILGSVAIVGSNVLLSSTFASVVVFYALVALAYNLVLKRRAGADLVGLSILYTLRLVAGAVAGGSELSNWLLAFSVFGFLSLAAAKRVVEIMSAQLLRHEQTVNNRGYVLTDSQTLSIVGVGSGLLSVLVIGLYIEEAALETPYQSPQLLWLLVPLWAYWVVRLWISVGRGDVDADPVIHVIRDWVSLAVVAAAVLIVLIARWAPL